MTTLGAPLLHDATDNRMATYAAVSARAEVERLMYECEDAAVKVRTTFLGQVGHAEARARYAALLKARAEALDRMSGRER
jgi:hypothetical protein